MANFEATVTAVLDTSQLKADLSNIKEKVNVSVNTTDIVSQIQNALKGANFNINVTPNAGGSKGSSAKNMVSEYKELYSLAQKMGRLDLRISGLDSNSNLNQIKELERQLTSLSQKFNTVFSQAGSKLSGDQKNNLQAVFADSLNKLKELEVKLQDSRTKLENGINFKINTGDIESKFNAVKQQFDALENKTGKVGKNFAELEKAYKVLSDPNATLNDKVTAFEKFNNLLSVTSSQIQGVAKAEQTLAKSQALSNKISEWMQDNPKAAEAYRQELEQIQANLQNCSNPSLYNKMAQQFRTVTAEASKLGLASNTIISGIGSFGKLALQVAGIGSAFQIFYKSIQLVKQGIQTVKELDDAIVDLKKTTTMSASELKDFYYDANESAKKLGTTTQAIIQSAADWSRLGFSDKQSATRMAELSAQFAAISPGLDVDDATSGLLSVIRAYGIEVGDVLDGVMSKINATGNSFGVSNEQIIKGLTKSAAAFAMMGGSLEENIALFTAAQEIVQNPEQVGNALRSISMRIRGYDENTEQLSEDLVNINGELIDLTKTSDNPNGISLFTDSTMTEYKSIGEYLTQISEIYDKLSAQKQQDLLEKLFGKNRATVGAAILKNIDQYKAALETMKGSAGSADAEMSIITSSISYHMNQLGQTWTGVSQNVLQSDFLINIIDGLNAMSEALQNLTSVSVGGAIAALTGVGIAITGIISALKKGIAAERITTLTAGFGEIATVLSGPVGWILAATTAIGAVWYEYDKYNKKIEDRRKATVESAKESSENIKSLDEYAEKVKQLREDLDSGNLSESEAYNTKKQLLDIQTQLNKAYGDSASGIDLVNGKLDQQIEKIKELTKEEATSWLNRNFESIQNAEKELSKNFGQSSALLNSDGFIGTFVDNQYARSNKVKQIFEQYSDFIKIGDRIDAMGTRKVDFIGNAEEALVVLNSLMTDLREARSLYTDEDDVAYFDSFINGANEVYTYAQGIVNKQKQIIETAKQYRLIEESYGAQKKTYQYGERDKTGIQWLEDYTTAVENYNEALASGDASAIAEASKEFQNLDAAIQFLLANNSDFAFFASMFNEVSSALNQSAISANEFGDRLKRVDQQTNWLKDNKITDTEFDDAFISGLGSDNTSRAVKSILQEYASSFGTEFGDLTTEQVEWVADYLVKAGVLIGDASKQATGSITSTLDTYKSSFENILETQENLNKAFESSSSAAGMNAEEIENVVNAYKDLESFDAESLFMSTADGVRVNSEAFRQYNEQLQEVNRNALLDKIAQKEAELRKARAEGNDENTIKSLETELSLFQLLSDAYATMTSDYTEMKDAMSNAAEVQNTLSEIFDVSQSGAALTAEQIQNVILAFRDLEGFNLSRLFNITSEGVRLNADAFREYNTQLQQFKRAKLQELINQKQRELAEAIQTGDPSDIADSRRAEIAMLEIEAGVYDAATESFTEYANALDRAQTAQTNLTDALEASQNFGGLTVEQIKNVANAYKDLESFDPANLFISTAQGVKLNAKEMQRLNDELDRKTEADLLEQIGSAKTDQDKAYWTAMHQAYQATKSDYAQMAKDLDRATNAQNNLNDAFEASQSATGMNAEQIQNVLSALMDLEGFDAKGLFEMTATGVRMNTEAFKDYNEQLQQNTKLQFKNQIQSKKNEIDKVLGGAQSEKSLSVLQNELFQLQLLANVYDGLTSEYSKMSNQIEVAKTNQESLNDAFEASKSDTGMTVEQIENVTKVLGDLAGFDAGQLFEVTSTGVRMNTEAFKEYSAQLEKQVEDNLEAKILSKENELIQAQKEYDKYSNGRTTAEKKAAQEAKARVDSLTEEIAALRLLKGVYDGMTSDYVKMSEKMSEAQNTQSSLVEAFSAANSATGLTIEQIKAVTQAFQGLEGFDAATLFEMTANGVRLNTKAFAGYQEQLQKITRRGLLEKIIEKEAELRKAQSKGLNTSDLENELTMYKLLASEYDGVTSKYNQYVNATSSASSRDSFEDVANGYEAVGNLINQGWVTDDSVTSYLDLLLGTDRVQDSIDAYAQLSQTIEGTSNSLKDYMTFDDDGNFTSLGAWNFVKDVQQVMGDGFASQGADGKWFLDLTGEKLQEVANQFKTTTEFVELLGKALADAGMEVKFDPKDIQDYKKELKTLDEELGNSQNKLKEIKDASGDNLLGDIDLDYNAASMSIDEIDAKITELNNKKIELEASADGVEGAQEAINALDAEIEALNKRKVMMSIGAALEGGATIGELLGLSDADLQARLKIDTSQVTDARSMLESLSSSGEVTIPLTVQIEEGQFSALTSAEGTANYSLGEYPTEVPDASGTANYKGVFPTSAPTITGTVVYSSTYTGGTRSPRASGTMTSIARSSGTMYNVLNYKRLSPSFADGKVSLPADEYALVNELQQESVVRNGEWFLLPPGPHIEHLKKGDIIFNAKQTQDLLSFGKTASYAHSYAYGTLPIEKSGGLSASGKNPWDKITTTPSNNKGNNTGSTNNTSKADDVEKLDWIERFFKKLGREIDKFRKIAESAFKSLSSRLSASKTDISKLTYEIEIQTKAYARYMQEAESVVGKSSNGSSDEITLSEEIKKLIRDGAIEISEYDKETRELISEYQEWYDKAQESLDTIDDLHEQIAQFYKDSFDSIQDNAESQIKMIDHMTSMYETQLDILKEQGYLDSTKIYEDLMDVEMQRMSRLQKEREDLQNMFDAAMASGEIEEDSEAWYEMLAAIDEVDEAIQESTLNLVKYGNTIQKIHWDYFDYLQDSISNVADETDFLIDLLSNSELLDENGVLNDKGTAVAGLHAQNYNIYMAKADGYAKEIRSIEAEMANDPYNQTLIERRQELLELQQKSIKSAEDEKKALVDLAEDGISAQIEAMGDLIDKYKESLDNAKDLYDYQKNVSKQSKNIANIEKQLAAYQNNTSEETRATIQKLKEDLKSAQEDLQETEYKQYISEQKKLLDELYSSYEEVLNSRLDDIDGLIKDMISSVNDNSSAISDTILSATDEVGYTLSDSVRKIWSREDMSLDGVVSYYGDDFGSKLTSTNTILGNIYSVVSEMISASDNVAVKKYASGGIVNYTGLAQLDGSRNKPEIVLDPVHAQEFSDLMRTLDLASSAKLDYGSTMNVGNVGFTGITDFSDQLRSICNRPVTTGNVDVGGIEINIPIDHVLDYDDFVTKIQKDKRFEEMMTAMTVDRLSGGSRFGKYRNSWSK